MNYSLLIANRLVINFFLLSIKSRLTTCLHDIVVHKTVTYSRRSIFYNKTKILINLKTTIGLV